MKITINTKDLIDAVAAVAKALPIRTTMPVLEGVYIKAEGGTVSFTCSDQLLQKDCVVNAVVDEEGVCSVRGKLFFEIVKKLPAVETEIETEGRRMSLKSGGTQNRMPCIDSDGFPYMRCGDESCSLVMDKDLCREMIMKTSFAAAPDDASRPFLTGVLLDVKDGFINFVATDSFQFALQRRRTSVPLEDTRTIVPAKAINEIARMAESAQENVELVISNTHVRFDNGVEKLTARLIDGDFINYERLLPTNCTTRILVERERLIAAVERAQLMAREGSNCVTMVIHEESIMICAESIVGRVEDELPVQLIGEPMTISFNPRYCLNIMKVIEDEELFMEFNGPFKPCGVKPIQGDDYVYLIVPVRV
ncbi:MAG TPA: DNA polymerase III subunit beta [Clostridia bacterium]|nr:DNA polymerase III subunit beta [Clostridia bacterium]